MSNLIYTKSNFGQSIQFTIECSTTDANSPLINQLKNEVSRITKAAKLTYEYEGNWTVMRIGFVEHRSYTLRLSAESEAVKKVGTTAQWVLRGGV
jgi:hypothetical protein